VIGIVASRLKDRYGRPACVVAVADGVGRGSGRSVNGFALGPAVIAARQAGLLVNGGGHAMAAGFTVAADKLTSFRDFLEARAVEVLGDGDPVPELGIDGALGCAAATPELATMIERVGPFGTGNAEPRFALPAVRIVRAEMVGSAHVRLILADGAGAGRLKAMAFRALDGALGPAFLDTGGRLFHIAGHLRIDRWQGRDEAQFLVDDAAVA
jgi:single-stranded-DNA-specific exonuclease